jgi:phage repressor protein C with HTH and peptisase S24 domain
MEGFNLLEIRNLYGFSQTEFARRVGMSRELVSKIEKGHLSIKKPTLAKVRNFLSAHPPASFSQDVDILWKNRKQDYQDQRLKQKNEPSLLTVPLVNIKAQAGYVKSYAQVDYIGSLDKFGLPPGVHPNGALWSYFEVDGDSMEPTLAPGDFVLGSMVPQEDWKELKAGSIYVLLTPEQLLVKRIGKKIHGGFHLVSDHSEAYPEVPMQLEDLRQVWLFRRLISARQGTPGTA